jgi:hypothetical protein
MSTSEAAVQVAPSKGEYHLPDVAEQASLVTTLVPSRFRTYSLSRKNQFIVRVALGGDGGGVAAVFWEWSRVRAIRGRTGCCKYRSPCSSGETDHGCTFRRHRRP